MKNNFQLVTYKQPCNLKFAARCLPLGLTAYGNTEDEAWSKLERMFQSLVAITKEYLTYQLVERDNPNFKNEDLSNDTL